MSFMPNEGTSDDQTDDQTDDQADGPTVADVTADTGRKASADDLPTDGPEQGDPSVPSGPGAGAVPRAAQPDHSADEDGYVGVDPIYRNASDSKRQPKPGDETSDDDE